MNRGSGVIPPRKTGAQARLAPASVRQVQFQIQFGEYGGSYVNHCHNTVHEDSALLMRIQLLVGERAAVTDTPNPTEDGVGFTTPEILPEGDPRQRPNVFVAKST
jgi:hypothetical protein